MKKIIAAIAMLLAVVPFIGSALNETTNYYSYKKGQIVNFYPNAEKEARHNKEARETIILNDKGANDKFVKVWLLGFIYGTNEKPVLWGDEGNNRPTRVFRNITNGNGPYQTILNTMGADGIEDGTATDPNNYFYKFDDTQQGVDLISLQELIDVFGAVKNGNIYEIPNKTYLNRDETTITLYEEFDKFMAISKYNGMQGMANGAWTNTVASEENETMWCIKFHKGTDGKINSITVEPESTATGKVYAYIPTAYANKTADCHQPDVNKFCYKCADKTIGSNGWIVAYENDSTIATCEKQASLSDCERPKYCYKCKANADGSYTYKITYEDDTEVATCEKVEQKDCNPKTGSKSHLLEFSIVAALCAISLLVVRRKDLFRTI